MSLNQVSVLFLACKNAAVKEVLVVWFVNGIVLRHISLQVRVALISGVKLLNLVGELFSVDHQVVLIIHCN